MQLPTAIEGPVAVIGDVHGQLRELNIILEKLQILPDLSDRWIVFIGDLVDRGPESRGAIDALLALRQSHPLTTALCGNHEFGMAAALGLIPIPEFSDWSDRWVQFYGSESTFESYGVAAGDLAALGEALPPAHREFLTDLPWVVEHPEFLFVHAGLDRNQPLDMQLRVLRTRDFSLTRPPWLCSKTFAWDGPPDECRQTVVSGHVPVPAVHFGDRKMLIDTTGGREGDLTCVLLPEEIIVTSGDEPAPLPTRDTPRRQSRRGLFSFWK
jgi:serine/threonine protein phosphatase 1